MGYCDDSSARSQIEHVLSPSLQCVKSVKELGETFCHLHRSLQVCNSTQDVVSSPSDSIEQGEPIQTCALSYSLSSTLTQVREFVTLAQVEDSVLLSRSMLAYTRTRTLHNVMHVSFYSNSGMRSMTFGNTSSVPQAYCLASHVWCHLSFADKFVSLHLYSECHGIDGSFFATSIEGLESDCTKIGPRTASALAQHT